MKGKNKKKKKRCNVPFELHKGISKIITAEISLGKLVIIIISIISIKKKNNF